jgi:hypothetical protein
VLRLFDSKNPLPSIVPEGDRRQFLLLFLHLSKTSLAGIAIAESLVPVYVWPAVRYTGEGFGIPDGRRVEAFRRLETGAFEIIDRRSAAPRPFAQMDEGTKNETD